jgi:hypothetical protein
MFILKQPTWRKKGKRWSKENGNPSSFWVVIYYKQRCYKYIYIYIFIKPPWAEQQKLITQKNKN